LNPEDAKSVEWVWGSGVSGDPQDTVRVLLGKMSSLDYSFIYWKWRDRPEIYRTPGSFIWEVSPRAADWKEHAFWKSFEPADVSAIAVDWRDSTGAVQHYRVERSVSSKSAGPNSFKLTEPKVGPASSQVVGKLFEKAAQFVADDFGIELDPNVNRVAEVIRTKPALVIRISLKNGTTHTLKAGPIFEGLQYAQHPYHRNLVWVFKWRFDYFRKTPEQLADPALR
jgi:hypothetical protein